MKLIGWFVTLIIILLGAGFSALNAQKVTVNFLVGKQDLPLSVILFITFTLGIFLSIFVLGARVLSLSLQNKWLHSKLKRLDAQTHISHVT